METLLNNEVKPEPIDFGNSKPVEKVLTKTPTTSDISDLLSQYKEAPPAKPEVVQNNNVLNPGGAPVQNPVNTAPVEYYKTGKKAGQPKPPKKVRVSFSPMGNEVTSISGEILTGALFITLIDLIIPIILAGLNNKFSKQKIKVSDLQLTAKQKNELAPVADKVVRKMNIEANPNMLLLFSLLGIYGANLAVIKFGGNSNTNNNEKNTNQNSNVPNR